VYTYMFKIHRPMIEKVTFYSGAMWQRPGRGSQTGANGTGRGAETVSRVLKSPFSSRKADVRSGPNGIDPKTRQRLTPDWESPHAPGLGTWTFSAPKSVSRHVSEARYSTRELSANQKWRPHTARPLMPPRASLKTIYVCVHAAPQRRAPSAKPANAGLDHRPLHSSSRATTHAPGFIQQLFICFSTAPRPGTATLGQPCQAPSISTRRRRKPAQSTARHLQTGSQRDGHAVERYGTNFRLKAIPPRTAYELGSLIHKPSAQLIRKHGSRST